LRNFRIVIQYEGTRYQGWQKQGGTVQKGTVQKSTDNTLQGKFEQLLTRLAGVPTQIHASGRTDAGVHAYGQVANFWMETQWTAQEMMEQLNRYLPEDVAVISCAEAAPRFHSRLNAVSKTYRYRILNTQVPAVFDRRYVWQLPDKLDVQKMREAAQLLCGTHDFAAFTSAKKSKKSTVRTITDIRIEKSGQEVILTFEGDGFLYHMVRILTGTLVEVGRGVRPVEDMEHLLAEKKRELAGELAPAKGLALMEVRY